MKSLVSFIIPIYNSQKTVERCIHSIQRQSYEDIEIICINDGSSDSSSEIINRLAAEDPRIIVVNKKNGGVSSARNVGLKLAKGKYLQFVDSDDYILKDMTSCLVKEIEENQVDLVMCGYYTTLEPEERISRNSRTIDIETLKKDFYVYSKRPPYINQPWNKLYKKSKISDNFDEKLRIGEDLVFNMQYVNNCKYIRIIEKPLYIYNNANMGSLSSQYYDNSFSDARNIVSLILDFVDNSNFTRNSGIFDSEFLNDFNRCAYNMILCSKKSLSDIRTVIDSERNNITWKKMIDNYKGKNVFLHLLKYSHTYLAILYVKIKSIMRKTKKDS